MSGSLACATELHPAPNLAAASDRFEIDPARHIALLRQLRGTDRAIIGCYHSHPNGRLEPSQNDCESAGEEKFLWLIAALGNDSGEPCLACFVSSESAFNPVRIEIG